MNQNYNCCDNTNTCGCGCNSQEGHWECTEVKPPVAPLTPELVKAYYEANPNTEAFTTINKAQLALLMVGGGTGSNGAKGDKGDDGITPHIDNISKNWVLGTADTGVKAEGIPGKDGKDGSLVTSAEVKSKYEANTDTNAFTDSLKHKLSTIEGSKFKGIHKDIASLELAHPAASSEVGSYAYLKDGSKPETMAMLDNGSWKEVPVASAPLTAVQVKALYEGNANTNAFTDTDKGKTQLISGNTPLNFDNVILDRDRASTTDIDDLHASPTTLLKFISLAGLRHAISLLGSVFIKKDGTSEMIAGYTPNTDQKVATKAYVDNAGGTGGLFQFDYKVETSASDTTPAVKYVSFDNTDFTKTTKLYINKNDRTNTDMSLFLKAIAKGDYFNIHSNNDINNFVAFDVTGKAMQNGDVFVIPVVRYASNGALANDERVFVHWEKVALDPFKSTVIHNIADIRGPGYYEGVAIVGAPVQTGVHITATKDSQGNIGLTLKDDTLRVYQGGIPKGGTAHFNHPSPNHLFGTTVPNNALGNDGDIYFKTV